MPGRKFFWVEMLVWAGSIQIQQKYYIKAHLCLSFSKNMKTQALLWWESIPREAHLDQPVQALPQPPVLEQERKPRFCSPPAKIPSNPRKSQHSGLDTFSRIWFPELLQMCGCGTLLHERRINASIRIGLREKNPSGGLLQRHFRLSHNLLPWMIPAPEFL